MNIISPDFLATPKPHHHVSRLLVLIVILAVILVLAILYNVYLAKQKPAPPVQVYEHSEATPGVVTADQLSEIDEYNAKYGGEEIMSQKDLSKIPPAKSVPSITIEQLKTLNK